MYYYYVYHIMDKIGVMNINTIRETNEKCSLGEQKYSLLCCLGKVDVATIF